MFELDWGGFNLQPNLDALLSVKQGMENFHQVTHLLLYDQIDRINSLLLMIRLIFENSSTGKFSIAAYISANPGNGPEVWWYRHVWNRFTPYRVMWRVFQNALAVDPT